MVSGYTETTDSNGEKESVFNADGTIIWCINSELESSVVVPIDFLTESQAVQSLTVVLNG
jgi:hypothetical protein